MSAVAKRIIIIASIIAGILAITGGTLAVVLNRPSNVVARSDRLDTPVIRGVEKEGDDYLLSFTYIPDATGYMVSEYNPTTNERHTQTYKGDAVQYAGDYVKVRITDFLFNTHTEADYRDYTFTATAKYSDQVFNSKESEAYIYKNKMKLASPTIKTINPNLTSMKWDSVEYATSYNVYLDDEDENTDDAYISTIETYLPFETIKSTFGERENYIFYVVAKNLSVSSQGYILDSDASAKEPYLPAGKLGDVTLSFNKPTKTLTWEKVVGATSYLLYLSTYGTSAYTTSNDSPSLFTTTNDIISCNLSGIECANYLGTTIVYIEAVSSNTNIASSTSNQITYVNERKLAGPTNITIASDDTYMQVSWTPSEDALYTTGYTVWAYKYTAAQVADNNILAAPQNYDVARSAGFDTSTTSVSIQLDINLTGYYGIAIVARAPNGSQYLDSDVVYYKNANNLNFYDANKILPAPNGIIATENEDGTIAVSWNIVENARRYLVKLETADGTGTSSKVFAAVDNREEINRVNTRIPPQVLDVSELIPGKYRVSVRTESGAYLTSDLQYNTSVSYPDGQDYVTYRIPFDMSGVNLTFNATTKLLAWQSVVDASAYEIYAYVNGSEAELVGSTSSTSYAMASYFADYHNDTGLYNLYIVAKAGAGVYRTPSKSSVVQYDFIQSYQPPTNLSVTDEGLNGRNLEWQTSVNANAGTTYSIYVNGNLVNASATGTSLNITDALELGDNEISIYANADAQHFESTAALVNYEYNYTLIGISGNVNVVAAARQYSTPTIDLVFNEVTNALGYNLSINDQAAALYSDFEVTNGVVTITLGQADVLKLNPFETNIITISPTNQGVITNNNIVVPTNISKNVEFINTYYLPELDDVTILTDSLSTNIISKIVSPVINIQFMPINLVDASSTYANVKPVQKYLIGVYVVGQDQPLNTYLVDISSITPEGDGSVIVNVFDAFIKENGTSLYVGDIYVGVSAYVNSPNEVTAPIAFGDDPVNVTLGLGDFGNIEYNETETGMMLSWDSVENAASYDVNVAGETIMGLIAEDGDTQTLDLQTILFDKVVGNYNVTITARLNAETEVETQPITVVKKLFMHQALLTSNNTIITIAETDLPSTLYDGGIGTPVVATHLVLLFDNVEAAGLYSISPAVLQNYTYKIVDLTALTPVNNTYSISITEFSAVQTCYVYAYNADNLASISEYITLDVGGAVQYSDPNLILVDDEYYSVFAEWGVELLDNDGVPTPPYYLMDIVKNDTSLIDGTFLTNYLLNVYVYDSNNALITSDGAVVSVFNNKIKIIPSDSARRIVLEFSGLNAGCYIFKIQAVTYDRAYANSSNIVQDSITLTKTLNKPITRFVPYDFDLLPPDYRDNENTLDMNGVDIDAYTGHPFRVYVENPTFDGLSLTTVAVKVQKDSATTVVDGDVYQLKTNAYGKYIELDKLSMGIYTTGVYTIYLKFVSPNDIYYLDSEYTTVRTLDVTSCEVDLSITNVVFNDGIEIDNATGFSISWQNNRLYPIDSIASLRIYELSSYTLGGTNTPIDVLYANEIIAYATNSIQYAVADADVYVVEFEIQTNVTAADEATYILTNYTNNAYSNIYLVNNNTKQFVYDASLDVLTITLDNQIALNNPTSIVLNGQEYAITSNTINSITFANGSNIISTIQPGLGNDSSLVPPVDRRVDVMVYKGESLVYNNSIDQFPVFVPQYANGVELMNDTVLYWNSVQYAQSYIIHISNALDSYTYNNITTNTVSMLDLTDIHGGLYNVYIEVAPLLASNVFVTAGTATPVAIEYLEPYDAVFGVTYTESLAGQTFDVDGNDEEFQYTKTLTWQIDTTGTKAPVDPQNKSMFVITLDGPDFIALKAVSSSVYNALALTLDSAELAEYIVYNNAGAQFSIDLTDIFNHSMVGEYSISIVITHIQSVATENDYKYRLQSRPNTRTFTNHKVMSIPSANIWDYLNVNPDCLVVVDAETGMATAKTGSVNDLIDRIATFNNKAFVVVNPFDYATKINVQVLSQTSVVGDVNINNTLGAASTTSVTINNTNYTIVVTLYLDENTDDLGLFEYYYVPTLVDLGLNANDGVGVDSVARTVSREYTLNTYLVLDTPTYTINSQEPDFENGVSGVNVNTLTLTTVDANNTSYLVNIYPNVLSGAVNTPDGFDRLVCASTYSTVIEVPSTGIVLLNDILQTLNRPFGKYWVSVAKLSNSYIDGTDLYALSSFQGEPIMFDYHYVLGDILDAEYSDANNVYTLTWSLLDVGEVTPVKYYVTMSDQSGNEITYWCIVAYANDEYIITSASADNELFAINDNKLTFFVDNFVRNTQDRNNYYLVGNYSYAIIATDDTDEVMNTTDITKPQPSTPSANNVISSAQATGNFVYRIVYPLTYLTATLEGNTLSWSATDESGLNLLSLGHAWQYRLSNGDFVTLNDVTETAVTGGVECSAEIMLDYTTRTTYKNTMYIRLLIPNETNFIRDSVGKNVTVSVVPQLPGFSSFKLDTNNANGVVKYSFDNRVINNSKSGTAYYIDDVQAEVLNLGLDFELTFNEQTIVLPNKDQNNDLTAYYNQITTQYGQLNGTLNLIQLMTPAQKAIFTQTINGVTEFMPGAYKLKLKLYDRTSSTENMKYLAFETEEQTFNIVSRWVTDNVSISGENITYYGDLLNTNGVFSKRLNYQTSVNWAYGLRDTALAFDITNPDADAVSLNITLWLLEYTTEYKANNCNLIVPADRATRCRTYDISSVISDANVWHVELDITELWQTVTLPREYYVCFYISESKNAGGTDIRRKSLSSSHSDELNDILGVNDETARNYAIIHYKPLATVTLLDYFEYDSRGNTIICWIENKASNDSYSYDVSIVELQYKTSWGTKGQTYTALKIRPERIQINGTIYQSYLTSKLTDLTDSSYYRVTVAVSDNTPDSYYIGNNGEDDDAKAESQKMYMYLDIYQKPVDADIYALVNNKVADLKQNATELDGLNVSGLDDNDSERAVVIINENTDPETTPIIIKFTQQKVASMAYRLIVEDSNGNIAKTYYIGRINNNASTALYIYYNAAIAGSYYTTQNLYDNAPIYILDITQSVGNIVKDGNKYVVTINGLTLSQLFGENYNNGADYTLKVSAFIPVYFHSYNAYQLGETVVNINPNINEHNAVNSRAFRYYIKFKAPAIANVTVEQQPLNSNEWATVSTIENRGGNYQYRLKVELDPSSIGTSSDAKMLAIYLDDQSQSYSLLNLYYTVYANQNTIYININDINTDTYSRFKQLVNTKLPGTLNFRAMMLPLYDWGSLLQDITPSQNSNNDIDVYNASNELIKNRNINSLVQGAASTTIAIQLPNVPLTIYSNQKSEQSALNNIREAPLKNGVYTNKYIPQGTNFTTIAVDPYLALNTNISLNDRTRSYLYNTSFASSGKFKFSIYVYNRNNLSTPVGTFDYNTSNDDIIDITELLNVSGYNTESKNNLYEKLKTLYPSGGAITLGVQLVDTQEETTKWMNSEITYINLDFYVRDSNTYKLNLAVDWENTKELTYLGKTDLLAPTISVALTKNNEEDALSGKKMLAKIYAQYKNVSNLLINTNALYTEKSINADVDLMKWLTDYCQTPVQSGLNNTDTSNDHFWLYALIGLDANGANWHIEFTVLDDDDNDYVCSNYIGNTIEGSFVKTDSTTNTKVFVPRIKLKTPTNANVYYKNGTAPDTLSPSMKNEIAPEIYQQFRIYTEPTFQNINTTALYIEITEVDGVSQANNNQNVIRLFSDGINNAFVYTDKTINVANRPEFINNLKNYINTNVSGFGTHTIKYKYVYYSRGNNATEGENMAIVQPSEELSFNYTKYNLVFQEYHILSVTDGRLSASVGDVLSDELKNAIGRISENEGLSLAPEYKGRTEDDGVFIICDKPQTDYKVYITQFVYDEIKQIYVKVNTLLQPTGATTAEERGPEYGYYYIKFNPNKADCLDNKEPGVADAMLFTSGYYTNYAGYLQGGQNMFYIVSKDLKDLNDADPYTLYSVGGSPDSLYHSTILNSLFTFKLQSSEYLMFSAWEGIPNAGSVSDWNTDPITKLNDADGIAPINAKKIYIDEACDKCNGTGYTKTYQKHKYVCIRSVPTLFVSLVPTAYNCYYKCKHCGDDHWELRWIADPHDKGHEIESESYSCYRNGECDRCSGSGTVRSSTPKDCYNVFASGNGLGNFNVSPNNYKILSWVFEEDSDKNPIYIKDGDNIIGCKIRVMCLDGNSIKVFTTNLMIGQTLTDVTLCTKYNFRIKIGSQERYQASSQDNVITIDSKSFNYTYRMSLDPGSGSENDIYRFTESTYEVTLVPKLGFEACFDNSINAPTPESLSVETTTRVGNKVSKLLDNKKYAVSFDLDRKSPLYYTSTEAVNIAYKIYTEKYAENGDLGVLASFAQTVGNGEDENINASAALFPNMCFGIKYQMTLKYNQNPYAYDVVSLISDFWDEITDNDEYKIELNNNHYFGTNISDMYKDRMYSDINDRFINGYAITPKVNFEGTNFINEWLNKNVADGEGAYKRAEDVKVYLKLYQVKYATGDMVAVSLNNIAGIQLYALEVPSVG